MLRRVDPGNVGYETAGDVLFRVEQASRYVDATARTLQALNLRLLGFGIEEFSAEEAKPIIEELSLFLERFGRRFGTMREDILRDVEELAALDENEVPHRWLQRLLQPADMRGDAQVRPGGEKSIPPRPKKASQAGERKIVTWITPRKVGERPDVASITQEKARRMRAWMESRGLYPSGDAETALSTGAYREFDDFPALMQLIESARLGNGERAKKLLGVHPVPVGTTAEVAMEGAALSFEDICFTAL